MICYPKKTEKIYPLYLKSSKHIIADVIENVLIIKLYRSGDLLDGISP